MKRKQRQMKLNSTKLELTELFIHYYTGLENMLLRYAAQCYHNLLLHKHQGRY